MEDGAGGEEGGDSSEEGAGSEEGGDSGEEDGSGGEEDSDENSDSCDDSQTEKPHCRAGVGRVLQTPRSKDQRGQAITRRGCVCRRQVPPSPVCCAVSSSCKSYTHADVREFASLYV